MNKSAQDWTGVENAQAKLASPDPLNWPMDEYRFIENAANNGASHSRTVANAHAMQPMSSALNVPKWFYDSVANDAKQDESDLTKFANANGIRRSSCVFMSLISSCDYFANASSNGPCCTIAVANDHDE